MLICKDCFADEELRSEFNSAIGKVCVRGGECAICHKIADVLLDSSLFEDFFDALLRLFSPSSESNMTVVEIIQKDWCFFRDNEIATRFLSNLMQNNSYGYTITTKVDYTSTIRERIAVWDELKHSIKENTRFFTDMEDFSRYDYLTPTNDVLTKGRILYRSRVTPNGKTRLKPHEMGCPPFELATAGRANPVGIPYLYLCESAKTTYYEVRAVYLDNLSVGVFRVLRDLKIVDFAYKVNLWVAYNEGDISLDETIIKKKIVEAISADMSKPRRRYDSEIEYVPTQLICEYCKVSLDADGICFESSLHNGGLNYVLFDSSLVKCTKVEKHEISKVDIDR